MKGGTQHVYKKVAEPTCWPSLFLWRCLPSNRPTSPWEGPQQTPANSTDISGLTNRHWNTLVLLAGLGFRGLGNVFHQLFFLVMNHAPGLAAAALDVVPTQWEQGRLDWQKLLGLELLFSAPHQNKGVHRITQRHPAPRSPSPLLILHKEP